MEEKKEIKATLSDLRMEQWLRNRERFVWETKDGRKVRLCDMTDDHLANAIKKSEEYWSRRADFDNAPFLDGYHPQANDDDRDYGGPDVGDGPDWDSDGAIL